MVQRRNRQVHKAFRKALDMPTGKLMSIISKLDTTTRDLLLSKGSVRRALGLEMPKVPSIR